MNKKSLWKKTCVGDLSISQVTSWRFIIHCLHAGYLRNEYHRLFYLVHWLTHHRVSWTMSQWLAICFYPLLLFIIHDWYGSLVQHGLLAIDCYESKPFLVYLPQRSPSSIVHMLHCFTTAQKLAVFWTTMATDQLMIRNGWFMSTWPIILNHTSLSMRSGCWVIITHAATIEISHTKAPKWHRSQAVMAFDSHASSLTTRAVFYAWVWSTPGIQVGTTRFENVCQSGWRLDHVWWLKLIIVNDDGVWFANKMLNTVMKRAWYISFCRCERLINGSWWLIMIVNV